MSAEGASGLREAVEALAAELEYPNPEADQDWTDDPVGCIRDTLRALLAAHPPEPEASAVECPTCKAVDNEYCSNPWHLSPTQHAPSDLAALLRAHEATNLVNSREHWVECGCGARLHVGEFDDPQMGYPDYAAEYNARAAHVAQVIADTYLPAVVREAEARHRQEWADYIERWDGAVGPEPPTAERIVAALRLSSPPFGMAARADAEER